MDYLTTSENHYHIILWFIMWATSKKSRMVSQLELQSSASDEPTRIRDVQSI